VYDYYLGGACNFAADREFGQAQIARYPDMPLIARENRSFLQRAVRHLVSVGVRQFLDIGSGLPTSGNVHQVAEAAAPGETRVVYVDHDPIAHSHSQLLLRKEGDPARHAALWADLLDTAELWQQVLDTGLIDPAEPVGLLLVAMLHFVPDDRDPIRAVRWLQERLVPRSFLVLSHATGEALPEQARQAAERVRADYEEQATNPGVFRSRAQVATFFGDWPLIDPGLDTAVAGRVRPELRGRPGPRVHPRGRRAEAVTSVGSAGHTAAGQRAPLATRRGQRASPGT
jgi:O-methyltransferase involved in polyketide biosynthesis